MMILIFIATLVIALLAQWHVKRAYARHSRTHSLRLYGSGSCRADSPSGGHHQH